MVVRWLCEVGVRGERGNRRQDTGRNCEGPGSSGRSVSRRETKPATLIGCEILFAGFTGQGYAAFFETQLP